MHLLIHINAFMISQEMELECKIHIVTPRVCACFIVNLHLFKTKEDRNNNKINKQIIIKEKAL